MLISNYESLIWMYEYLFEKKWDYEVSQLKGHGKSDTDESFFLLLLLFSWFYKDTTQFFVHV